MSSYPDFITKATVLKGSLVKILAISSDVAAVTHAATSKTTPANADELGITDSEASFSLKKLTFANLKSTVLAAIPWASPGAIGGTTPSSGAFTTLSAAGNAAIGGTVSMASAYEDRSPIYNGLMQVWQDGTTFTGISGTPYTADGWKVGYQDCAAEYRQVAGFSGCRYAIQIKKVGTVSGSANIQQNMETENCQHFAGKMVTLSCYARLISGAPTQASHNIQLAIGCYSTVDATGWCNSGDLGYYQGTFYTGGNYSGTTDHGSSGTLSSTEQRFWVSFTVPSGTKSLVPTVYSQGMLQNGGIEVTGIYIEEGNTPTALPRTPYEITLARCQRYYRVYGGSENNEYVAIGNCYRANDSDFILQGIGMRVTPTVSYSSLGHWQIGNYLPQTCTAIAMTNSSPYTVRLDVSCASGMVMGSSYLRAAGTASARLKLNARL